MEYLSIITKVYIKINKILPTVDITMNHHSLRLMYVICRILHMTAAVIDILHYFKPLATAPLLLKPLSVI